jgi:predicted O-methyltransferase YrrM
MNLKEFYENRDNKSDKGTTHDYISAYYNNEFTSKRFESISILEIGIHTGLSLKLWKDWFENANIFAIDPCKEVDILQEILDEIEVRKNVTIIKDDAYTQHVLNMFEDGSVDYIIDDGPHTLQSQLYSIKHWIKKIKPGGKLIIEDIQSINDLNNLVLAADETDMKWEVYDMRSNKGRYDDIILEITINE